jgi:hypothetical protein
MMNPTEDAVNREHDASGKGGSQTLSQRFPNFFQVGTTFISQNVLRTTLVPFESKLF